MSLTNCVRSRLLEIVGCFVAVVTVAPTAQAFCGFYVAGADTSLYANATMVVLMRDGTQTVISMQNNYEGPAEGFALVVPVPEVLTEDQVKTLPDEVFARVDQLGAPRLVEYWEVDPCQPLGGGFGGASSAGGLFGGSGAGGGPGSNGVTVEAQFQVGEYNIVILSAEEAAGLETWLVGNNYNIPEGAAATLAPYVEAQTKFFVAAIDPARVTFEDGQAALSPLRIAYNSDAFSLPIRLGLLNSRGTQDLIINILARSRYEVANYDNLLIPTNIRVREQVRSEFPGFYEALFAEAIADTPTSVVTEYSWSASSCDPCPTPSLTETELATLGADVISGLGTDAPVFIDFTLTRLHYRYSPESADEDLMFAEAAPIVGGRGIPDRAGELDPEVLTGTAAFGTNNFQGRYVLLNPWTEAITCDMPQRGLWGGPNGMFSAPTAQAPMNMALVGKAATASDLRALIAEPIPALGVTADVDVNPLLGENGPPGTGGTPSATASTRPPKDSSGCAVASSASGSGCLTLAWGLGFLCLVRLRGRCRRPVLRQDILYTLVPRHR